MTRIETARVNETLGLQIGVIQDAARKLRGDDLEQLETDLVALESSIRGLRDILAGLPHHR
jgi:hypothetical protein